MSASDDRRIQKTMRAHHKQTTVVVVYCIEQSLGNAHLAVVGATLAKRQINAIVRRVRVLFLTALSARVLVLAPSDTAANVR
jgi:hypothetical protein